MKNTRIEMPAFALRPERLLGLMFLGLGAAAMSGCSGGDTQAASPAPATSKISGIAMGGNQPVVGTRVEIFAVGTGYGTGATSLGFNNTDSKGAWTVNVSCPTSATQVYAVATGGNPGSGTNNQLGLIAALGQCGVASGLTNVNINEVTTVAAVFAAAQFLDASTASVIGAPASNNTGLVNALGNAATLADITTGLAPASPATGVTLPTATVYTLANLIAGCVNSSGGVAGDTSACGHLFSDATPSGGTAPTTTLQAALDIALNPSNDVGALFSDIPATPVFSPNLGSTAPNDWTLALQYAPADLVATAPSSGSSPASYGLAIDASGNAWVTLFDGASVIEVSPSGTELSPSGGYTAGGDLVATWGLGVDPAGNLWVANHASPNAQNNGLGTIVKLDTSGNELGVFDPTLDSLDFVVQPSAVAFDGTSSSFSVFVTDYNNTQDGPKRGNILELDSSGNLASPSPFDQSYDDANLTLCKGLVIDSLHNIWVSDVQTKTGGTKGAITEVPEATLVPMNQITTGGINGPYQLAIDSGNNVWVANVGAFSGGNSVSKFSSAGAVASGSPYSVGGSKTNAPWSLAVDGADNVWVAMESASNSDPSYTGSVLELTSAGATVGPSGFSGFTAGGAVAQPTSIAIDASGNVWTGTNTANNLLVSPAGTMSGGVSTGLTVLLGVAKPVKTPLLGVPAIP